MKNKIILRKEKYRRVVNAFAIIARKLKDSCQIGSIKKGWISYSEFLKQYDTIILKKKKGKLLVKDLRKITDRFKIRLKNGIVIEVDGGTAAIWNKPEQSDRMSKRWKERKKDNGEMEKFSQNVSKGTSKGMKGYWTKKNGENRVSESKCLK